MPRLISPPNLATMRVFLLPISTRRTLLYAHRLNAPAAQQQNQGWLDKVQTKAAQTWADWEKKNSGWQSTIVKYGNQALRKIPYEEWSLKSVPPLSTKRADDELKGTDKVEVIYPKSLMAKSNINDVMQRLSTEREGLHRKRLIWCLIGMPISAPFAAVPMYVLVLISLSLSSCKADQIRSEYQTFPFFISPTALGRTGALSLAENTYNSSSRTNS